jgi:hypothetical protein
MWNPPIVLSVAEQTIAARTRNARKFFVFLREYRHELLDADFQNTLTKSSSPGAGGHEPAEAGLLALATLLQAYSHVGDRDAVELTVMDKRWQMVLDCPGAGQPPVSQGALCNFRMRLIAHNLDKTLLDQTVALAEKTGGFGTRQLCAVLDSTPLCGASRVEETLNLLGHALRQGVGLTLLGHSSLQAQANLADADTTYQAGLFWGTGDRRRGTGAPPVVSMTAIMWDDQRLQKEHLCPDCVIIMPACFANNALDQLANRSALLRPEENRGESFLSCPPLGG